MQTGRCVLCEIICPRFFCEQAKATSPLVNSISLLISNTTLQCQTLLNDPFSVVFSNVQVVLSVFHNKRSVLQCFTTIIMEISCFCQCFKTCGSFLKCFITILIIPIRIFLVFQIEGVVFVVFQNEHHKYVLMFFQCFKTTWPFLQCFITILKITIHFFQCFKTSGPFFSVLKRPGRFVVFHNDPHNYYFFFSVSKPVGHFSSVSKQSS